MNLALLGGGGFISSAVERRLLAAGHQVTVLNRSGHSTGARVLCGRRNDKDALAAIAALEPEAVVDFRCFTGADAQQLVEVFAGRVERLVVISTGSVYWSTGVWRNPVAEDQYPRASVPRRAAGALDPGSIEYEYGTGKRAAEDVLEAASEVLPSVRLRFPVVGGPGDPTGRYAGYVRRVADGGPLLIPGGGGNSFRHLYVEDAAAAVVAALETPGAHGGYNVASHEITSLRDMLAGVAACLGRAAPQVVAPEPSWLDAQGMSSLFAPFSAIRDQILDPSRAVADLDFQATPYAQWLAATVAAVPLEADVTESKQRQEELEAVRLYNRTLSGPPAYLDAGEV